MAFTLCSSGAIVLKAGKNVNTEIAASGAFLAQINEDAEALVCAVSRYDWITNYGSLNASSKPFLAEVVSNLAAPHLISYDMSGWDNVVEAEDAIIVLRDAALRGLSIIRDEKTVEFMD